MKYIVPNNSTNMVKDSWVNNYLLFNLLKPNDIYICRTVALTSRRYILYIYSTNIRTEYMLHNLRFFLFKMPFIS